MNITKAVILGVVQGLTEFFPVSSSGHLAIVQHMLGVSGSVRFFDTLLHCGTLVAVCAALRRDIWAILRKPFQPITWLLGLSTAVTGGCYLLFRDAINRTFENPRWLGPAFLITAAALFCSARFSHAPGASRRFSDLIWFDAVFAGIFQCLGLVPGVSRSGITVSAALFRRFERGCAARFSFLLSIPAISGALFFQILELAEHSAFESVNPGAAPFLTGGMAVPALAAGTAAAAVTGFFAVKLMLKIVRERALDGFAAYTALLGVLVLIDQRITHVIFS
jgi:undecaprenyl-diphosphatase